MHRPHLEAFVAQLLRGYTSRLFGGTPYPAELHARARALLRAGTAGERGGGARLGAPLTSCARASGPRRRGLEFCRGVPG